VRVSCTQHRVEFRVQQIDKPNAPVLTSIAQHNVRNGLDKGTSPYVIGGVGKRNPAHHWDGQIDAVRIIAERLEDRALSAKPATWQAKSLLQWQAKEPLPEALAWASAEGPSTPSDPRKQALADLCHVLLNANEFIYLH
jgi:hypothetical protein